MREVDCDVDNVAFDTRNTTAIGRTGGAQDPNSVMIQRSGRVERVERSVSKIGRERTPSVPSPLYRRNATFGYQNPHVNHLLTLQSLFPLYLHLIPSPSGYNWYPTIPKTHGTTVNKLVYCILL